MGGLFGGGTVYDPTDPTYYEYWADRFGRREDSPELFPTEESYREFQRARHSLSRPEAWLTRPADFGLVHKDMVTEKRAEGGWYTVEVGAYNKEGEWVAGGRDDNGRQRRKPGGEKEEISSDVIKLHGVKPPSSSRGYGIQGEGSGGNIQKLIASLLLGGTRAVIYEPEGYVVYKDGKSVRELRRTYEARALSLLNRELEGRSGETWIKPDDDQYYADPAPSKMERVDYGRYSELELAQEVAGMVNQTLANFAEARPGQEISDDMRSVLSAYFYMTYLRMYDNGTDDRGISEYELQEEVKAAIEQSKQAQTASAQMFGKVIEDNPLLFNLADTVRTGRESFFEADPGYATQNRRYDRVIGQSGWSPIIRALLSEGGAEILNPVWIEEYDMWLSAREANQWRASLLGGMDEVDAELLKHRAEGAAGDGADFDGMVAAFIDSPEFKELFPAVETLRQRSQIMADLDEQKAKMSEALWDGADGVTKLLESLGIGVAKGDLSIKNLIDEDAAISGISAFMNQLQRDLNLVKTQTPDRLVDSTRESFLDRAINELGIYENEFGGYSSRKIESLIEISQLEKGRDLLHTVTGEEIKKAAQVLGIELTELRVEALVEQAREDARQPLSPDLHTGIESWLSFQNTLNPNIHGEGVLESLGLEGERGDLWEALRSEGYIHQQLRNYGVITEATDKGWAASAFNASLSAINEAWNMASDEKRKRMGELVREALEKEWGVPPGGSRATRTQEVVQREEDVAYRRSLITSFHEDGLKQLLLEYGVITPGTRQGGIDVLVGMLSDEINRRLDREPGGLSDKDKEELAVEALQSIWTTSRRPAPGAAFGTPPEDQGAPLRGTDIQTEIEGIAAPSPASRERGPDGFRAGPLGDVPGDVPGKVLPTGEESLDRAAIIRGDYEFLLRERGIITEDTPQEQIDWAILRINEETEWAFGAPNITDDEKYDLAILAINRLFPADVDDVLSLAYQQQLEPLTEDALVSPPPSVPGMGSEGFAAMAQHGYGEHFDEFGDFLSPEIKDIDFLRAARSLADDEAAKHEEDPRKRVDLAKSIFGDITARQTSLLSDFKKAQGDRYIAERERLEKGFVLPPEFGAYAGDILRMGRKESARAIRDDFKFSDFIRESAPGLGAEAVERRKLKAFDYPEVEETTRRGRNIFV